MKHEATLSVNDSFHSSNIFFFLCSPSSLLLFHVQHALYLLFGQFFPLSYSFVTRTGSVRIITLSLIVFRLNVPIFFSLLVRSSCCCCCHHRDLALSCWRNCYSLTILVPVRFFLLNCIYCCVALHFIIAIVSNEVLNSSNFVREKRADENFKGRDRE